MPAIFSSNAQELLKERYYLRDINGDILEDEEQFITRIVKSIASVEKTEKDRDKYAEAFTYIIKNLYFMPSSPILFNAGTDLPYYFACYVLEIPDSVDGIFERIKESAIICKTGGGVGVVISDLRPAGDKVGSTGGVASGPISFLRIFNTTLDVIKQGSRRRGAGMAVMDVSHPDIEAFIRCKGELTGSRQLAYQQAVEFAGEPIPYLEKALLDMQFTNFNISVGITDKFMNSVEHGGLFPLINPRNNQVYRQINARELFNTIVEGAWKNGEPGIVFLDTINKHNSMIMLGKIKGVNVCLTGDSLIPTECGLQRLSSIYESFQTSSSLPKLVVDCRVSTPSRVGASLSGAQHVVYSGYQPVYKVITHHGYEIKATADHKLLTTAGWLKVSDLQPGDNILIQSGEGVFSKDVQLPIQMDSFYRGQNGCVYQFNFPTKWTKELGWLLGWFIADGYFNSGKLHEAGFSFDQDKLEVMELIIPVLQNMLPNNNISTLCRGRMYYARITTKWFIDFLAGLGVKRATAGEKEVPEAIYMASEDAVIGFLQALFTGDGTIRKNRRRGPNGTWIALSSKSKKLLQGVQILLLNLGIKSTLFNRFCSPQKKGGFKYVTARGEEKVYIGDGVLYELGIFGASRDRFCEKIGFLTSKKQEEVRSFTGGVTCYREKFYSKVVAIEPVGYDNVYDIVNSDTHSFIANGIVVSNCSELPLFHGEACCLGSINLSKFVSGGQVDYELLGQIIPLCVRFLDNVIDASKYPLEINRQMILGNRRIGLGIMGWHDMLLQLGISYASEEALKLAEELSAFIYQAAEKASRDLAVERGPFPNWELSTFYAKGEPLRRHCGLLTIAPTGTISMIADCSSGIEPLFALTYKKITATGKTYTMYNKHVQNLLKTRGVKISELKNYPDVKNILLTAREIDPDYHLRMQAAWQKHVCASISKTINMSHDASIEDVTNIYLKAWYIGLKGVTIYRDKSRGKQVLYDEEVFGKPCPVCGTINVPQEGCYHCVSCNYSACSVG